MPMPKKPLKEDAEASLIKAYKKYVATKLANDPEFSEKYLEVDTAGNKVVNFTPEMFSSVSIGEVTRCGCSCNFIKGWGDNCDADSGDIICSDQAGATPR